MHVCHAVSHKQTPPHKNNIFLTDQGGLDTLTPELVEDQVRDFDPLTTVADAADENENFLGRHF